MHSSQLSFWTVFLLPLTSLAAPSKITPRVDNADTQKAEDAFKDISGRMGCITQGVDTQACDFKAAWMPKDCRPREKREWKNIVCTAESVNQTSGDPAKRWGDLKVLDAWCDVLETLPADTEIQKQICPKQKGGDPELKECFSEHMAQIVKGSTGTHCGSLDEENGCHDRMDCKQDLDKDGRPVAGAGGYMIYNSLQTISASFWNLYSALDASQGNINTNFDFFIQQFATDKKDVNELLAKALIGAAGFIGAGAVAGTFNGLLRIGREATKLKDSSKELGYAYIGFLTGVVKDKVSVDYGDNKGVKLKSLYLDLIDQLREGLREVLNELFSGNARSLELLSLTIENGAVFNPPVTDALDLMRNREKVAYNFLIPQSWIVRGITPVIFPTGKDCNDLDGALKMLGKEMNTEDADKGHACVDDQIYVIADPHGTSDKCESIAPNGNQFGANLLPGNECKARKFSLPENWDHFSKEFGDLNIGDVIAAAVATNKEFGNGASSDVPDLGDFATYDKVREYLSGSKNSHYMPGLVHIPICAPDEARKNWNTGHKNGRLYPCNG